MRTERETRVMSIGFVLVAICLGVVQFSILGAQSTFALAAILWLVVVWRDRRLLADVPPFFTPLLVYAALTLASAAMSSDPRASFWDSRQLFLFLMVPVVARFARGDRAAIVINTIIALGAAGAVVGIIQFAMFGFDELSKRPMGPLGHYMTYSGVLMLVTGAAVARLLFHKGEWIWPAIAVPALLVALGATYARNAWVGVFVAVVCLLALRNWKLIIIAPVAAVILFALAPAGIRQRAVSMFDLNDPTNRDRRAMLKVGAGMIQDHPFFGVGPEMIQREYARYRPPEAVNPTNPHLHNVPVQIAAERGLPALFVWIWFVVVALRDLLRQLRHGPAKSVAAAGVAAVIGMLVAGLFEYNFGDSEFLMLFLGLITLPYAAARARAVTAGFEVPAPAPANIRASAS
jgi:O-antigen ligase